MSAPRTAKVTKADVERKLRDLQGGVEESFASRRQKIIGAGIALGVLTLLLAYMLGRRTGRKKNTIVEIRRY